MQITHQCRATGEDQAGLSGHCKHLHPSRQPGLHPMPETSTATQSHKSTPSASAAARKLSGSGLAPHVITRDDGREVSPEAGASQVQLRRGQAGRRCDRHREASSRHPAQGIHGPRFEGHAIGKQASADLDTGPGDRCQGRTGPKCRRSAVPRSSVGRPTNDAYSAGEIVRSSAASAAVKARRVNASVSSSVPSRSSTTPSIIASSGGGAHAPAGG